MAKERILVVVKTYPTLSTKHIETACTAGFREDGSWVRIYPIPFRLLNQQNQFKKYQWIELDISKRNSDPRPESYNPINIDNVNLLDSIGTEQSWNLRKKIVLQHGNVYTNLSRLIQKSKDDELSLAVFKPTRITGFKVEPADREWDQKKLDAIKLSQDQRSLFEQVESDFKIMPKLPYKFSYKFEDDEGRESTLMIEDWEIGELYWNCLKSSDEETAIKKVRQKYEDNFAKTKDLYLFLGTTLQYHGWAKNPFVIIGTFYPPHTSQLTLDV